MRWQIWRTVWGRYFPGFTEHEQCLHSKTAFRDAVRRTGGLTVVATQTFKHPRSSTAERLQAQAEGRHCSTFSLHTPEELRASAAAFLARLPRPEVCWVDEHLLVVGAGLRAAWRRDGMTRDETTWTWWTLPPPISRCLARRYHRHPPLSSRPCWTSRNARSRSGLRRPAGCLLAASGHTPGSARTSPAPVDQRSCGPGGADAATYSSRTLRSMVGLPATCACSRRSVFTEARPGCKAVQHRLGCLVRRLRIGRITGCHGGGVMPEPPLVRLSTIRR